MTAQPDALLANEGTPARAPEAGLTLPLQEMQQEDREPVDEFALLPSPKTLSISSAMLTMSAAAKCPARNSAACSIAQA